MNVRDLQRAHAVSTQIEQNIKAQIQNVDHVLVHYEPIKKETITFAVMLDDRDGKVSDAYGKAPYLAMVTKHFETGEILDRKIVENPFVSQDTGKGIALSEFLVEQGVDVVFTRTPFHGKGPEYVFADANVEIQIANETGLENLVRKAM